MAPGRHACLLITVLVHRYDVQHSMMQACWSLRAAQCLHCSLAVPAETLTPAEMPPDDAPPEAGSAPALSWSAVPARVRLCLHTLCSREHAPSLPQ